MRGHGRGLDVGQANVQRGIEVEAAGVEVVVEEVVVQEHGEIGAGGLDVLGDYGVEVGDVLRDVGPATAVVAGHWIVRCLQAEVLQNLFFEVVGGMCVVVMVRMRQRREDPRPLSRCAELVGGFAGLRGYTAQLQSLCRR